MKKILIPALFCTAGILALPAQAEQLPLWEVGAGLAVFDVPQYRGSDWRNTYALPLPYVIYRGKFLKADREGVRAALLESERLKINLSVNGTLPARSEDNPLRAGMQDLKPTVEIGPTIDVLLWKSADRKMALDFRIPVRAAFTIESSPRHIGWLSAPNLLLSVTDPGGWKGWKASAQTGPVFNSRRYNNYFYGVGTSEALPGRPAYEAPGGYAGTQAMLTLSKRFRQYWVGAFVRHDRLSGASFADSPLMERRSALSAGLAVAWVFGASSTMVEARE